MFHNSKGTRGDPGYAEPALPTLPPLYSIKTLYLTQRDSCWKATKALNTLFLSTPPPPSTHLKRRHATTKASEVGPFLEKAELLSGIWPEEFLCSFNSGL